jgi:hypothetical protein
LYLFHETDIQAFFLRHPFMMLWINRIYSFIHIPGTILFLAWLFWYTTTQTATSFDPREKHASETLTTTGHEALYEARRRTMALCNLLAFIVFTAWPCMPPRLLSDPDAEGPAAEAARQYGFVDTVHGADGESSVWTQNKFCNQYAAMPSLHFGYSLLIGLTIMTIPVASSGNHSARLERRLSFRGTTFSFRMPSVKRLTCIALGVFYPGIILTAIIATANHFILDAVAGAMVCGIAWSGNKILLNLMPLQDWFLLFLRVHIPEKAAAVPLLQGSDAVEKEIWSPDVDTEHFWISR